MQGINRLLLLLIIFLCACTKRTPSAEQKKGKALNLIVLLDLSDRLTIPGQINRDTNLIRHIYNAFEQRVRQQLYINSQDQIQVLVAPQRSLPAGIETIEDKLRINMQEVPMKERSRFLRRYEPAFMEYAKGLYQSMEQRPANSFSGSDIWKFFDQYLRNYLVPDTNTLNKIIVLTDGYFDFESLKDKKQEGCRYSYSEKLMQQARAANVTERPDAEAVYEQMFSKCGLIPVHINQMNVSMAIAEMTPRNNYRYELEILESIWNNWSTGIMVRSIVPKNDLQLVKQVLAGYIINAHIINGREVM